MGFLRALFGPSRQEIWQELCNRLGAEYDGGSWFTGDALRLQHGEWEIVLDEYTRSSGSGKNRRTKTYTRFRAPFVNKDNLYFEIYRESIFSPLGKMMGFQDIQIGDDYFDDNFVIKGNSEQKIRQLLNDQYMKDLIHRNPDISFTIKDDEGWFGETFPNGVDQLYFSARVIRDVNQLHDIFDLFATTLERLVKIDSAYEDDPNVHLSG